MLTVLILNSYAISALAFYHPEQGRWINRDPIEEQGGVLLLYQSGNPVTIEKTTDILNPYVFVGNQPLSNMDLFGLLTMNSTLSVIFSATYHNYTEVGISVFAGDDSGRNGRGCPCKKPKLAQAVSVLSHNLLQSLIHGNDGHWEMDGGTFYPYQKTQTQGATLSDAPGTRAYISANWIWGVDRDFETCAICTDEGPGKYWVISCAKWGQKVGGMRKSSQYGNSTIEGRTGASATFLSVFPSGLLGN